MRALIISVFLVPYLYYGGKDHIYHFQRRRVSLVEHFAHLLIGISVTAAIWNAYAGRAVQFTIAVIMFLVAGAADEYIWHRGLSQHESDLHAKGHLALFAFVVVSLATIWLEKHHWRMPRFN